MTLLTAVGGGGDDGGGDTCVCVCRGMSSRLVASMIAASVMFGVNGTLREVFGADSRQVKNKTRTVYAAAAVPVLLYVALDCCG